MRIKYQKKEIRLNQVYQLVKEYQPIQNKDLKIISGLNRGINRYLKILVEQKKIKRIHNLKNMSEVFYIIGE